MSGLRRGTRGWSQLVLEAALVLAACILLQVIATCWPRSIRRSA
jgi:hypothetical protein